MKIRTSESQQQKAVLFVNEVKSQYTDLLAPYYNRLLNVYKELNSFTQPKYSDYATTFKVNKMHEVSNKILPKIVSREPKWIVSVKPDYINGLWQNPNLANLDMQARAVQDLLSTIFRKDKLKEAIRLWAKGMINFWTAWARIITKYDISRNQRNLEQPMQETYIDEEWNEAVEEVNEAIDEKVVWEYATIDVVSWTQMLYDPRYILFNDMPAVIHTRQSVRLSEIKNWKDDYMNVDKLEALTKLDATDKSKYQTMVQGITWLKISDVAKVDKNNITLDEYYWYYDLKDNDNEKLYKISIANGILCIGLEEITQIPFEQIRCFEDTETNLATWFLEPIMWLQQELNYKKNAASEYINNALNRSWIWSAHSGINPRKLISRPNNIIPTTKTVQEAQANLQELPMRSIDSSYFNEQNDFERQIQWLTFTVDTSNTNNAQALTNTATWIRIKFYESNTVVDEIRKHFEEWLERLAYKLLEQTAENYDKNIVIKKMWDEGFWKIHKEAIVDSLEKYEIQIETWTSSYDTIESRREDAIAKYNIWVQAAANGVQVNLEELFKDVLGTFEWVIADKYIQKQWQDILWMLTWWNNAPQSNAPKQLENEPVAWRSDDIAEKVSKVSNWSI